MSTMALDVPSVRARFSALQAPTVFFDGPGGTQCPDSVIDAIADYLRESNANLGGAFGNSRRSDALIAEARLAAASFLRCEPDEVVFGQNMTSLSFTLSRTVGRALRAGDEILVTKLDHDGNISPWLELARDLDLQVAFVDLHDDTTLDLEDLDRRRLHGIATMDGRVPTFAFTVEDVPPRVVSERLAEREIAVWDGNYYALEVMERLGLGAEGAVRAGFVHYNTVEEVDRLLAALAE